VRFLSRRWNTELVATVSFNALQQSYSMIDISVFPSTRPSSS
jgi:hypothetical protein